MSRKGVKSAVTNLHNIADEQNPATQSISRSKITSHEPIPQHIKSEPTALKFLTSNSQAERQHHMQARTHNTSVKAADYLRRTEQECRMEQNYTSAKAGEGGWPPKQEKPVTYWSNGGGDSGELPRGKDPTLTPCRWPPTTCPSLLISLARREFPLSRPPSPTESPLPNLSASGGVEASEHCVKANTHTHTHRKGEPSTSRLIYHSARRAGGEERKRRRMTKNTRRQICMLYIYIYIYSRAH